MVTAVLWRKEENDEGKLQDMNNADVSDKNPLWRQGTKTVVVRKVPHSGVQTISHVHLLRTITQSAFIIYHMQVVQ